MSGGARLLLATFLLAGCPGERESKFTDVDLGLTWVDSGERLDSTLPTPDGDGAIPTPEQGVPTGCEKKCIDQAPYLCVESNDTNLCVECTTDAHCAMNSSAAGSICDTENLICTCSTDDDCEGKVMGSRCHEINEVCSCVTDTDCGGDRLCIGAFFGSKYCKLPCTSDDECASNMFETVCDKETGCQECVDSTECGPTSLGSKCNDGLCVCSGDDDCSNNVNGRKCLAESELCGCETDFDCPEGTACTAQYVGNTLCK